MTKTLKIPAQITNVHTRTLLADPSLSYPLNPEKIIIEKKAGCNPTLFQMSYLNVTINH